MHANNSSGSVQSNPKINAVCGFCRQHNRDPVFEINFIEAKVYYLCPFCEKENRLDLRNEMKPFPKTRVGL